MSYERLGSYDLTRLQMEKSILYQEVHECVDTGPHPLHHDVLTNNFCNAFGAEFKTI